MQKANKKEVKNYKAIFFDFGGTLMDAESDNITHFHMMKAVIKKYNLPASPEDLVIKYNSFLFTKDMTLLDVNPQEKSFAPLLKSTKRAFEGILSKYDITPSIEDFYWFKELYFENHKKYIKLFPETFEIIEQIRNNDSIHLGIISDIDNDYMDFQFNVFGIKEMFDSITTSEEVQIYKPEAKIFQVALNKANCQGEESIIVGDSYKKDIIGGKDIGMTTIWINKSSEKDTDKNKADFIVTHLKEIFPILKGLIK
jgi:HAD superfamily hydrolase (TIGR01549 family)